MVGIRRVTNEVRPDNAASQYRKLVSDISSKAVRCPFALAKGLTRHCPLLPLLPICAIIILNMAIKVTRKDQGEANENIIRRFNRKVLQSGMMPLKKSQMRFAKPMSKRERRVKAIIREARKAEKTERIKLGLK